MDLFGIIGLAVVILVIGGILVYIGAAVIGIILLAAMAIGLVVLLGSCGGSSAAALAFAAA